MIRFLSFAFVWITFFSSLTCFSAEFELALSEKNITLQEKANLSGFVKYIEASLPKKIKNRISTKVWIQFETLSKKPLEIPICNDYREDDRTPRDKRQNNPEIDRQQYSRISQDGNILLDLSLIPGIVAGPQNSKPYPCGHRNLYRLASAILIHQLALIYDSMENVSHDRQYRRLTEWRYQWTLTHGFPRAPFPQNKITIRSPDPYESRDIRTHFAVNLEFFLLDPEYGCRRPAVNRYFVQHFSYSPHQTCQGYTKIPIYSTEGEKPFHNLDFDPKRIFEIQYLYASQGHEVEELWGHAMIRFVICSPTRKEVGPDCRKDTEFHAILGYDPDYPGAGETWKGLTGQYPTHIYINSLQEIADGYTKGEFRNVLGFPLKLSESEKEWMVYQLLEQYWEYQGRYYFINNNCTTEIANLFQGVLDQKRMRHFKPLTPYQVIHQLAQVGYLDNVDFDSIHSVRERLESAFKQMHSPYHTNLEQYLYKTSPEERRSLNLEFLLESDVEGRSHRLSNWHYLESYIVFKKGEAIDKKIYSIMEKKGIRLGQEAREARHNTISYYLPVRGYGIPTPEDFDLTFMEKEFSKTREIVNEIYAWAYAESELKSDYSELDQIDQNLKLNQSPNPGVVLP